MKLLATAVADFQSTLKGIQDEEPGEALCALEKQAKQVLSNISRENIFYKSGFLHLSSLKSTKIPEPSVSPEQQ